MEFPKTGEQCSVKDCKQIDFLPFVCEHCHVTFCKTHFHMVSHECSKYVDNVKTSKDKSTNYLCSKDSCNEKSPVEMSCVTCKKHFCLGHRHHGCSEIGEQEKMKKLKKWQIPKQQFAEAKAVVEQEISTNLKKTKNTTMANKIHLMRVKRSATGPKNVPTNERFYFNVYAPVSRGTKATISPRGIYVNMHWTIGRAVDAIADVFKIPNLNNTETTNKLQLFHHSSGNIICSKMDTPIKELSESSVIVDGQTIVLEYSDNECIDPSLYKEKTSSTRLQT